MRYIYIPVCIYVYIAQTREITAAAPRAGDQSRFPLHALFYSGNDSLFVGASERFHGKDNMRARARARVILFGPSTRVVKLMKMRIWGITASLL